MCLSVGLSCAVGVFPTEIWQMVYTFFVGKTASGGDAVWGWALGETSAAGVDFCGQSTESSRFFFLLTLCFEEWRCWKINCSVNKKERARCSDMHMHAVSSEHGYECEWVSVRQKELSGRNTKPGWDNRFTLFKP